MCGINGSFSYFSQRPLPENLFRDHEQIAVALSHRGPDRTDHFKDTFCILSANQLNSTGLDNNQQPVRSECGEIISVLNGELYNYKRLNKELQQAGYVIRTNCDAETLNKLYMAHGPDCFSKIHGIFGAAIYDRRAGHLILARDRFGQIPLFYCEEHGRIHFASESNELVRFTSSAIDADAMLQLFSFGFSFDHLVKGIKRLRPGTYLIADQDGTRERTYWKPTFHIDYQMTEQDVTEKAFAALQSGVRDLAPKELPHGVFISGGIDSGIVARIAEALCPGIHFFTSGLTDAQLGAAAPVDVDYSPVEWTGNELAHADALAFSTTSAEYVRGKYCVDELIHNLHRMIKHLPGGPVMSTSFPPFYFTALEAQRYKIRVNFTGEGADELHAGYVTCQPEEYPRGDICSRFIDLSNFTTADERVLLFGPKSESRLGEMCEALRTDVDTSFEGDGFLDDLAFNKLRFFMLTYVFAPHLVEKGNGMAMIGGPTELRMPFLSDGYVDVVLNAPPRYIRTSTSRKMLLHKIGRKAGVPARVIDRPKQRTSLPYYNLFYHDSRFQHFARTVLNKQSLLREFLGLEDPGEYVLGLAGRPDAHKRAWLLLILEIWMCTVFRPPNHEHHVTEKTISTVGALA